MFHINDNNDQTNKVNLDSTYKTLKIYLSTLENQGFPIDDFVNYKTNEKCDKTKSYALRKYENNKFKIEVYYKCGTVANYDLTTNNN